MLLWFIYILNQQHATQIMIFISKNIWIVLALLLVTGILAQEQPATENVPQPQPVVQNVQSNGQSPPNVAQSIPNQPNPTQPAETQEQVRVESSQPPQTQQASGGAPHNPDMHAEQLQFNDRQQVEARMSYERVRREQEERARQERMEMQKLMHEAKLNKTEEIRNKEKHKFLEQLNKLRQQFGDVPRDNYMFEVEANTFVDFHLVLPHSQEVAFYSVIYSTTDGIIKRANLLDENNPMQIYVYENDAKLVYSKNYYFVDLVRFAGKAEATYTIKFITKGEHRIVELTVLGIVEQSQVAHTLTTYEFNGYGNRVKGFYNQMSFRSQREHMKRALQGSNKNIFNEEIKRYYIYTIAEIVLVAALCIIQVEVMRKMLKRHGSVV